MHVNTTFKHPFYSYLGKNTCQYKPKAASRIFRSLKRIDDYKAVIDGRRPLTKEEVRELDAYFCIGFFTVALIRKTPGNTVLIRYSSAEPNTCRQRTYRKAFDESYPGE